VFRGKEDRAVVPPLRTHQLPRAESGARPAPPATPIEAGAKPALPATPVLGMPLGKPIGLDLKRAVEDELPSKQVQVSPRKVVLRDQAPWRQANATKVNLQVNLRGKGKGKWRRRRGGRRG